MLLLFTSSLPSDHSLWQTNDKRDSVSLYYSERKINIRVSLLLLLDPPFILAVVRLADPFSWYSLVQLWQESRVSLLVKSPVPFRHLAFFFFVFIGIVQTSCLVPSVSPRNEHHQRFPSRSSLSVFRQMLTRRRQKRRQVDKRGQRRYHVDNRRFRDSLSYIVVVTVLDLPPVQLKTSLIHYEVWHAAFDASMTGFSTDEQLAVCR